MSTKVPPPLIAKVGKEQRAAVEEAGALLRDLGHDVVVRDPDYPPAAVYANFLPRYFRGIYEDVRALPHQDRLEKRTRNMARIGSLLSERRMATVRAGESAVAERIQSIFDDVDVVITPGNAAGPSRIGAYQRRGGIVDPAAGIAAGAVLRALECHRPARGRGAVGAGPRRRSAVDSAGRPPE